MGRKLLIPLALSALLGLSAIARAETPPPAEQSRIVYANGGRIVAINSDGTERKVLTRKGKVSGNRFSFDEIKNEAFDRFPQLSPDGSEVLFFRQADGESGDSDFYHRGKTMVVKSVGGKPRELFGSAGKKDFRDATWIPGSNNLLAVRRDGDFGWNSVVVVGPGGKVKRTILKLKLHGKFSFRFGMPAYSIATQLSVSPDGSKFLMTKQDAWVNSRSQLELVDMRTGKRKVVRKRARQGRWAPDGSRFTFVAAGTGGEYCADSGSCREPYDVFVADAKGKNVKRVKSTHYDEQWPSFSPDGLHLSFSANRIKPSIEESREIYRMGIDGTCVDWLTNGTPASVESDWGPGALRPSGCEPTVRKSLIEGKPGQLDIPAWGPRFWLGEDFGGALVSSSVSFLGISLIEYRDCGEFRRADCPKPILVAQAPVCLAGSFYPAALQVLNSKKIKMKRGKVRGVSFRTGYAGGFSFALTFTGKSLVATMRKSSGVRSGRLDQLALIKSLRPTKGKNAGRLPVFRVPVSVLKRSRKVKRTVRRHGIRKAAKRLGMSRWQVRTNLRLRANLRSVGPVKPVRCGFKKNVAARIDSGSSSALAGRMLAEPAIRNLQRDLRGLDVSDVVEGQLPPIDIPDQVRRAFLR